MGKVPSSECGFCAQEVETFLHVFWTCPVVSDLMNKLIDWCTVCVNREAKYNMASCLIMGFDNKALNNIFIIAKYYIFTQRLFKHPLNFKQLLYKIRQIKRHDYLAFGYLPQLNMKRFYAIWGNIPASAFQLIVHTK